MEMRMMTMRMMMMTLVMIMLAFWAVSHVFTLAQMERDRRRGRTPAVRGTLAPRPATTRARTPATAGRTRLQWVFHYCRLSSVLSHRSGLNNNAVSQPEHTHAPYTPTSFWLSNNEAQVCVCGGAHQGSNSHSLDLNYHQKHRALFSVHPLISAPFCWCPQKQSPRSIIGKR